MQVRLAARLPVNAAALPPPGVGAEEESALENSSRVWVLELIVKQFVGKLKRRASSRRAQNDLPRNT